LVQFNTETTLKPSKDGKSTEIAYTSVSSSAGKIMGMETPKFMRQQFALESFMRGLRNVVVPYVKMLPKRELVAPEAAATMRMTSAAAVNFGPNGIGTDDTCVNSCPHCQ
jgi:hypothetical protein